MCRRDTGRTNNFLFIRRLKDSRSNPASPCNPRFGLAARTKAALRTAASSWSRSGPTNAAGKASPADAAACDAAGSSDAGKPFDSTIPLSVERASMPPRRARESRTTSCSRSGFSTPNPAKRRHSASSAGTAASSERETISAQTASIFDGPAFWIDSSKSSFESVSTDVAAGVTTGSGTRRTITLPRSANRSSWFGVASRSERKAPESGGAGPVSDGFIVEHRRGPED